MIIPTTGQGFFFNTLSSEGVYERWALSSLQYSMEQHRRATALYRSRPQISAASFRTSCRSSRRMSHGRLSCHCLG